MKKKKFIKKLIKLMDKNAVYVGDDRKLFLTNDDWEITLEKLRREMYIKHSMEITNAFSTNVFRVGYKFSFYQLIRYVERQGFEFEFEVNTDGIQKRLAYTRHDISKQLYIADGDFLIPSFKYLHLLFLKPRGDFQKLLDKAIQEVFEEEDTCPHPVPDVAKCPVCGIVLEWPFNESIEFTLYQLMRFVQKSGFRLVSYSLVLSGDRWSPSRASLTYEKELSTIVLRQSNLSQAVIDLKSYYDSRALIGTYDDYKDKGVIVDGTTELIADILNNEDTCPHLPIPFIKGGFCPICSTSQIRSKEDSNE